MKSSPHAPVLLLEGCFVQVGDDLMVCPTPESGLLVGPELEKFLGREVFLQAHHAPPVPPEIRAPGFGSCLAPEACEAHRKRPHWCFHTLRNGELTRTMSGNWVVDGSPLPLDSLAGHRGRILVFAPQDLDGQTSVSDLFSQAQDLVRVLTGLKGVVEEEV